MTCKMAVASQAEFLAPCKNRSHVARLTPTCLHHQSIGLINFQKKTVYDLLYLTFFSSNSGWGPLFVQYLFYCTIIYYDIRNQFIVKFLSNMIWFGKSFIKFCKSFINLIKLVSTLTCSLARVRSSADFLHAGLLFFDCCGWISRPDTQWLHSGILVHKPYTNTSHCIMIKFFIFQNALFQVYLHQF